jgi:hypothetical protein
MGHHAGVAKLIALVISLVVFDPAFIRADQNNELVIAHLEFLGYTCDVVEQGIRARHHSKIHLLVSHMHGGLLLQTGFPGKPTAGDDSPRYATLNAVNSRTRIARSFWTPEGHLLVIAWLPGGYEKLRFAAFMEAWEQDAQTLRGFSQELKPYLAE